MEILFFNISKLSATPMGGSRQLYFGHHADKRPILFSLWVACLDANGPVEKPKRNTDTFF